LRAYLSLLHTPVCHSHLRLFCRASKPPTHYCVCVDRTFGAVWAHLQSTLVYYITIAACCIVERLLSRCATNATACVNGASFHSRLRGHAVAFACLTTTLTRICRWAHCCGISALHAFKTHRALPPIPRLHYALRPREHRAPISASASHECAHCTRLLSILPSGVTTLNCMLRYRYPTHNSPLAAHAAARSVAIKPHSTRTLPLAARTSNLQARLPTPLPPLLAGSNGGTYRTRTPHRAWRGSACHCGGPARTHAALPPTPAATRLTTTRAWRPPCCPTATLHPTPGSCTISGLLRFWLHSADTHACYTDVLSVIIS